MYEVTIKFDTKEEMIAHFSGEETTPAKEVEEKKAPAKKKAAKKAAPKKEEPKIDQEKEPEIVQEEPTQQSPGQAAFNREACLGNIGAKIQELTSGGMEGNDLANLIAGIFTDLGQAQCKISQLDDSTLINFSMAFNKAVEAKTAAPKAAAFI